MIYIKDKKGVYVTIKDIAREYDVPVKLIQMRYVRGLRTIDELTQPKWEMLKKQRGC